MTRQQMTRDESSVLLALQFMSLDGENLARSLPKAPAGVELEIFQTNFRTDNPLFCIGYESYRWFEVFSQRTTGETAGLFLDMAHVLDNMFVSEPTRRAWIVEPSGPVNRFWSVLRTLATIVLQKLDWPRGQPEIDLQTWITVGRWVPKRVPSTRRCLDAFGSLFLEETGFSAPMIDGDVLEVEGVDVGLLPDHPWYKKPLLPKQFLSQCKLVFEGVGSCTRMVVGTANRSEDPSERNVLVDVVAVPASAHDELLKTYTFSGTMINLNAANNTQQNPLGQVMWTVTARSFNLVDENYIEIGG